MKTWIRNTVFDGMGLTDMGNVPFTMTVVQTKVPGSHEDPTNEHVPSLKKLVTICSRKGFLLCSSECWYAILV